MLTPSTSITAVSNRQWLFRHQMRIRRYLMNFHNRLDWETILDLLYWGFPDEGRKLIENFDKTDDQKLQLFLDYLIYSPQVTWLTFADERMGKDAFLCWIIEKAIERMKSLGLNPPRIVTLGNIKIPPFVDPADRFWSFKQIPSGSANQEVWIYCSELEVMLPARDGQSPENKLFSIISGTLAQNHCKLLGCVKLASKVDLNAIRGCNMKAFKYINPEKLQIAGVERENILSPLGYWLLPRDRNDKSQTLLAFDNQLFTISTPLPSWWTQEYSEQFNEVDEESIWAFIDATCDENTKADSVMTIISSKFRNKKITLSQVKEYLSSRRF